MTVPILQVKNLTTQLLIDKKAYNVVNSLSFCLFPGKTLAIVGESGCGKSITALSIMGILPHPPALPASGEVLYRGQNLLELSDHEMRKIRGAKIAMIFQDPSGALNPVYPVGAQLIEVAELHLNLYGEEAYNRSVRALREVGISLPEQRMLEYPHQMSGGMKQRVMIAMALMCEPDILIADEPTTALDVTIQAQILDLIRELQKRNEMALLLITHDMGIVAEIADEVMVMYASEGIEKGEVHEIFDHMAHPYTIGLFGSIPKIDDAQETLSPIEGSVPNLTQYPTGCRFHPRCPYVMEKCCNGVIPTFSLGEKGHWCRCVLYDGSEESNRKLKKVK